MKRESHGNVTEDRKVCELGVRGGAGRLSEVRRICSAPCQSVLLPLEIRVLPPLAWGSYDLLQKQSFLYLPLLKFIQLKTVNLPRCRILG